MANLHSRYATRLLVKLAEKPYQKEDDIYKMARDIAWHEWFDVSQSIRVNTTAVKSPLKSLDFVTLRVKDGVIASVPTVVRGPMSIPIIRISGFNSS